MDGAFVDYFGARLFVPRGHFDEAYMLAGGTPEPHVIGNLKTFVSEGDSVLDIGANIGSHAFALASLVGPSGKVFAVEADIDNAACIRRSIVESQAQNLFLIPAAAADRSGLIRLYVSDNTNSVFSPRASGSEVKVAVCVALDALIHERISFIKMDIEGAELLALYGMEAIIAYSHPVILTEFAPIYITSALGFDRSEEFVRFFFDRGYHGQVIDPDGKLHLCTTVKEVRDKQEMARVNLGWNHIEVVFTPQ